MAFNKPNVNYLWAETGTSVEPAGAKVSLGWIAEIPDFEFENWIQKRQDQFNAHVNQYGMPVWDSVTEYIADKSYVQGSDGFIYRALSTHTNSAPPSANWVKAFNEYNFSYSRSESDTLFLAKSRNLSELTNKATARTNLSVYSKTESDGRYYSAGIIRGMVAPFAGTPPSGWLVCDGLAVSRSAYFELFNQIGTTFGTGDGSTTFNLPDLRNEFIRGADSTTRPIGTKESDSLKSHTHTGTVNSGGGHSHTATTGSSGSHSHTGTTSSSGSHTHSVPMYAGSGAYGRPLNQGGAATASSSTGEAGDHSHTFNTNSAGAHTHTITVTSGGAHTHTFATNATGDTETRPRNIALLYAIKY